MPIPTSTPTSETSHLDLWLPPWVGEGMVSEVYVWNVTEHTVSGKKVPQTSWEKVTPEDPAVLLLARIGPLREMTTTHLSPPVTSGPLSRILHVPMKVTCQHLQLLLPPTQPLWGVRNGSTLNTESLHPSSLTTAAAKLNDLCDGLRQTETHKQFTHRHSKARAIALIMVSVFPYSILERKDASVFCLLS